MPGPVLLGDGRSVRFDGDPPVWAWHDEVMGFKVTFAGEGLLWSGDDLRGRTFATRQSVAQYFALGPNASDLPDLIHEDLTRWLRARHSEHAGAPDLVWRWMADGIRCSAAIGGGHLVWEESDRKGGGGRALQSYADFFDDGPALASALPGIVLRIADAIRRREPGLADRATPFVRPALPSRVPPAVRDGSSRVFWLGAGLLVLAALVYLGFRGGI